MAQNKKSEPSSFAQWKAKKAAEKKSKELGCRLRHVMRQDDNISQGEALEIIQLHGDDPIVINSSRLMYWTPIFLSILDKKHDMTRALMHAPALNVNERDIRGSSILIFAMTEVYPNHELISYLLTRSDLDLTIKTFTYAETFLKSRGIGGMVHEYRGATALFCATERQEFFQYIPIILDKMGNAVNDNVDCVTVSSSTGSRYIETRSPLTNLVKAINKCKPEQRGLLLSCIERIANSKPDDAHKKSKHPLIDNALITAAANGDKKVVEILLAAGANKEAYQERSAYDVARYAGHQELAEYIQRYSPSLEQQMAASGVSLRK